MHEAMPSDSISEVQRVSTYLHPVKQLGERDTRLFTVFTVDVSDPDLVTAISGHIIDDVVVCSESVFIEIACTVALFIERTRRNVSRASLTTYEVACLDMQGPIGVP